jgi:hypothetical protein
MVADVEDKDVVQALALPTQAVATSAPHLPTCGGSAPFMQMNLDHSLVVLGIQPSSAVEGLHKNVACVHQALMEVRHGINRALDGNPAHLHPV